MQKLEVDYQLQYVSRVTLAVLVSDEIAIGRHTNEVGRSTPLDKDRLNIRIDQQGQLLPRTFIEQRL